MKPVRVAIVGSEEKYWTAEQREEVVLRIVEILSEYIETCLPYGEVSLPTLISGGCPKGGVDIWAEIVATIMYIPKKIFIPDILEWKGRWIEFEGKKVYLKGYKDRNMEIAKECDVLYCIDPAWRDWSGGRWTMNYAKKLGKEVHLELIK